MREKTYLTNEEKRDSETLLKAGFGFDTRKKTNRAPDTTPALSLADIDGGIDLEQLDALTVPVYRYETQITIHGIWPELATSNRFDALGYKSLIRNKNGSLGVRYTAIDANKKRLVSSAISLARGCYSVHSDSKGFALQIIKHATQANLDGLREIAASFPDSAIIGHKGIYKASSLAGSFVWLEIRINAIPASGLWRLIDHVTNGKIVSRSDYDRHKQERTAKRERENAQYKRECEERAAKQAVIDAENRAKLDETTNNRLVPVTNPQLKTRYIVPGLFGYDRKPGFAVVEYRKAFGKLSRARKLYKSLDDALANLDAHLGKGRQAKAFDTCFAVRG